MGLDIASINRIEQHFHEKILAQTIERYDFLPCSMATKPLINDLFKDFAKHTKNDWLRTASSEIEGKDPDETLAWKVESLTGKAYYDKTDLPNQNIQLAPSSNPYLG